MPLLFLVASCLTFGYKFGAIVGFGVGFVILAIVSNIREALRIKPDRGEVETLLGGFLKDQTAKRAN